MTISVTVKTLDSQNHNFENLSDDMTVADFKEHISPTVGSAADRQRLIYCGRVLQDAKKLNEYGVNGKVIHLVQRSVAASQGPDPVAASEARARGASPARGRTHHIHIQQEPDFIPSMTFRLNVAQELLQRANRTIDRLENPNSTDPSSNGNGGNGVTSNSNDVAGLPELSQVIQSAVNNAMQSIGSNEGPGEGRSMNIEMSVQIGPNGQMIAQQTPSASASESSIRIPTLRGAGGSSGLTSASTPAAAAASESSIRIPIRGSSIGDTGSDQTNQQRSTGAGNNRQPLQHPPLSSMADTMDELEQTETRFRPFRQRLYDLLRQDPEYPSDAERQANQVMISRVTSVMHTLSHVQHALSDAVINLSQNRPRHLRARPLMIQSRVQSTMIPNGIPFRIGRNHPMTRGSTSSSTSTSSTTTTNAGGTTPANNENNLTSASVGEVEVSVEPIIVGIELESGIPLNLPTGTGSPPSSASTTGGGDVGGQNGQDIPGLNPQNLMQMFQSAIMNAARAQGVQQPFATGTGSGSIPTTSTTPSNTNVSSSSTIPSSAEQQNTPSSGQDSQARGGTQTQPTTSTQTRSSTHVIYGPRRPFAVPPISSAQTFDPLLPCNSHHITGMMSGRRGRHPAGSSLFNQRPRSASVPPRPGEQRVTTNAAGGVSANQQPQSTSASGASSNNQTSSARSSPHRVPSRFPSFGNLDFEVSTHIDVVPMMMTPQGIVPLTPQRPSQHSTSRVHLVSSQISNGGGAGSGGTSTTSSSSGGAADAMEPSLAQMLGALQSNSNSEDANMLQVVMGIMRELSGVVGNVNNSNSGSGSSQSGRTISAYLESLPDYSYTEGESLVTDLLMLIARNTTFSDLVNILLGNNNSLDGFQRPIREFLRRYVLVPPNDDEHHDVDAAILHLVDSSFPQLEEMAGEVQVRSDVDFAETMHSFLAANLSTLAETVLHADSPAAFGAQFRDRGNAFLSRLVSLCLRCSNDGNASLERVVRNRLEAMSGDVGSTVREWILSAAVGHLRNFVARLDQNSMSSEDVEQYIVHCGRDAEQRQGARRRRLLQFQTREDETFVTPRSSPPRRTTPDSMDTDEPPSENNSADDNQDSKQKTTTNSTATAAVVDTEMLCSKSQTKASSRPAPPNQIPESEQRFPQSLLAPREVDSTIPIGSQPWHGTLPSNWIPIVSRDVSRQSNQEGQRPFSDAYLTTQAAKRRRLASNNKPSGTVSEVISDVITDAIQNTGIQPLSSVGDVLKETSSQSKVQKSLQKDAREAINRRINQDPDFDGKKFPYAKDFKNSK